MNEFIGDPSLVLYLPLYKLDGATITSKDAYGHTFTATNTSWRPAGRYFGGADYLRKAVANFQSADSAGSIIAWFKASATAYLIASADEATTNFYLTLGTGANGIFVQQKNNDAIDVVEGDTPLNDNAWHLGAVVSNGTAWALYHDGIADGLTVGGGANSGDWFADTTNRDSIVVGGLKRSDFATPLTGYIGDVLIYNRALTPLEIQNIYLSTKRRYR